ncbi:hypothetical protein quinque_000008, partial [Culex quinquefasciatus]
MYAVNFTEVLANNIRKADPSWPTQPCRSGWEYNFTDVPYRTAATDVSCNLRTLRIFARENEI